MMRRWILSALLVTLVSGCSPWIAMHEIEPGMNKAEVMQRMGTPSNVAGSGNEEYLWYVPANRFWERYYVHLVDGKVESYGQVGKQEPPLK